ncbi:hypothetical protein EMIT0111MI5_230078 [Burkholderia sp. IT-111MI5]
MRASSSRVRRVAAKEMFIGGIGAIAARGHTPRSLLFGLGANEPRVTFTGDAAKNRAELLYTTWTQRPTERRVTAR